MVFLSLPPSKDQDSSSIRPWPLPSTPLPIHSSFYHPTEYSPDAEKKKGIPITGHEESVVKQPTKETLQEEEEAEMG
jgi:hypothetical protein